MRHYGPCGFSLNRAKLITVRIFQCLYIVDAVIAIINFKNGKFRSIRSVKCTFLWCGHGVVRSRTDCVGTKNAKEIGVNRLDLRLCSCWIWNGMTARIAGLEVFSADKVAVVRLMNCGCFQLSVYWDLPSCRIIFRCFSRACFGQFPFRERGFDFVGGGATHQVKADHLVSALRWLASGPIGDHQAGNGRTVGLDRDAVLIVNQQATAAQQVHELPNPSTLKTENFRKREQNR